MSIRWILPLATTMLLLVGCSARSPHPTEAVALRPINASGLEKALAQHRGKVVLVDFWATWCGPCLELLPHTIDLQRRFADRGLRVITVSLDDADKRSAVEKFLAEHGGTTENYLSTYGVGPAAFTAFGIDDGALPHLQLFDRQGKLHQTFASGGLSIAPAEIERAVVELTGEKQQAK
jgi:thiol-disulfide isomerase/thioredoxin